MKHVTYAHKTCIHSNSLSRKLTCWQCTISYRKLTVNLDQLVIPQVEDSQIVLCPGTKLGNLTELVEAQVKGMHIVNGLDGKLMKNHTDVTIRGSLTYLNALCGNRSLPVLILIRPHHRHWCTVVDGPIHAAAAAAGFTSQVHMRTLADTVVTEVDLFQAMQILLEADIGRKGNYSEF